MTLFHQIVKFTITGFLSFFIDYGVTVALTEFAGFYYLISALFGFLVATVFNYWVSTRWIFLNRSGASPRAQFVLFVTLGGIGLALHLLFLWLLTERFHLDYRLSKVIVTGMIMVWNFVTRKLLIEKRER